MYADIPVQLGAGGLPNLLNYGEKEEDGEEKKEDDDDEEEREGREGKRRISRTAWWFTRAL